MSDKSTWCYVGDESLLPYGSESTLENFFADQIAAAFCWEIFGLADGSKNTWNRPGFHATGFPGAAAVVGALDIVLSDILEEEKAWLLDIPIGLKHKQTFDAKTLVTSDGRAAIELPMGAFAGLFGVNDVYWQIHYGEGIDTKPDTIMTELPSVLKSGVPDGHRQDSIILSYFDAYMEREKDPTWAERSSWVWCMTSIQHVFLILHEFGHLALEPPQSYVNADKEHFEREINADRWAGEQLVKPLPYALSVADDSMKEEAIYVFFLAMEILRSLGHLNYPSPFLKERYSATRSCFQKKRNMQCPPENLPLEDCAFSSFFAIG